MPTYGVGPARVESTQPPVVRRPLVCEHCREALGEVQALAEYAGMSADAAAQRWPQIAAAVRGHEQQCRPDGPCGIGG